MYYTGFTIKLCFRLLSSYVETVGAGSHHPGHINPLSGRRLRGFLSSDWSRVSGQKTVSGVLMAAIVFQSAVVHISLWWCEKKKSPKQSLKDTSSN